MPEKLHSIALSHLQVRLRLGGCKVLEVSPGWRSERKRLKVDFYSVSRCLTQKNGGLYVCCPPGEALALLPPFASALTGNISDFVCSHNLRLIPPFFYPTLLGACTWFSPTLHLQMPLLEWGICKLTFGLQINVTVFIDSLDFFFFSAKS